MTGKPLTGCNSQQPTNGLAKSASRLNERTGTMIEFYIYSKAGNYLSTSKAKDWADLAQIKAALENNQQKITIIKVGV